MLMCLPLMMAGCSKDNNEDTPVGPAPEIPGENASGYIEFTSNLFPLTRAIVNEDAARKAYLYAWTQEPMEKNYTIQLVGFSYTRTSYDDLVTVSEIGEPAPIMLTRNQDDLLIWDYENKLSWAPYMSNPVSFLAFIEPEEGKTQMRFLERERPHEIERIVKETEYDAINKEYYYNSGDLNDVMMAYSRDCTGEEFSDKEVDLNFRHLFPRLVLNAKVADNTLEVNVDQAYFFGLQTNGKHKTDTDDTFSEAWTCPVSPLNQYVQMDLSSPMKLTTDFQPVVDKGHEPHLIPQQIKPWTSFANRNGAGIIMNVNIRNTHDNSWIVGNASEKELVYIPFPLNKIESGKIYNIDVVFGTQNRENGTAYGYQLSYQPRIVDWDTENENVELKR